MGSTNKLAKPRSYASSKLRPSDSLTHLLTRVKSRATSVANKKYFVTQKEKHSGDVSGKAEKS